MCGLESGELMGWAFYGSICSAFGTNGRKEIRNAWIDFQITSIF